MDGDISTFQPLLDATDFLLPSNVNFYFSKCEAVLSKFCAPPPIVNAPNR